MKECIYQNRYGGKWWHFICCHVWNINKKFNHEGLIIEKNNCIDCGRKEILILVEEKEQK